MDARQLAYFLAVVDAGSVRRAAAQLFVAQPSVSQALRSLKRDLGGTADTAGYTRAVLNRV